MSDEKVFLALRLTTDRFIRSDELAGWAVVQNKRLGWHIDVDQLANMGRCLAQSSDDESLGSAVTFVELPDVLEARRTGDTLNPPLSARLWAAVEALRSYQHGNSSPELAEEVANSLSEALVNDGVLMIATQDLPRECARMQLWINAQGVPQHEMIPEMMRLEKEYSGARAASELKDRESLDDFVERVKPR